VSMALTPRGSIARRSSSALFTDDLLRPIPEEKVPGLDVALVEEESTPVTTPVTGDDLTSFLSMSRVKQLTLVNFCLSNLGVGCFFSILGPFFPNEVYECSVIYSSSAWSRTGNILELCCSFLSRLVSFLCAVYSCNQ